MKGQSLHHENIFCRSTDHTRLNVVVHHALEWDLILDPVFLCLRATLCVDNVANEVLKLFDSRVDVYSEFARGWRWAHRHTEAIVEVKLVPHKVNTLQPTEHVFDR